MIIFYFLIFIFGLIVGSFLNVLIDRLPNGEDIVFRPSHCDNCRKQLKFFDLFPLFSFLLLKGKCRYCHKKIARQNPLVEIVTASVFVFIFSQIAVLEISLNNLIYLFYQLLVAGSLIVIFIIDLKERIIPDSLVFFLTAMTLIYRLVFLPQDLSVAILAAFGMSAIFLFLVLITRGRGMGLGDVKYAFFMGLFLGWPKILVAFYLAFLTGAIVSLILVMMGRKSIKSTVPFGPFLVVATFLSFYFGEVITVYFHKLLFRA
ncbi:hypothetical protein A2W14_07370 [Candidatus Gottesmanbacteria bacterium RBG_16_37_8]|uniref:Prepilin leader peptidase/N-methyltransferase n=1 Tax=Candidatus Gottesmanbacteria bacterium RBG_16_37_8 TaxID=1798371 RepID=A0A1F5YRF5_9BACT|nr:MAG: hypothetical protein A2W14_07370 [Candidatus Gottesmanbacteria bacterium RBG_16_37_8]